MPPDRRLVHALVLLLYLLAWKVISFLILVLVTCRFATTVEFIGPSRTPNIRGEAELFIYTPVFGAQMSFQNCRRPYCFSTRSSLTLTFSPTKRSMTPPPPPARL